VENSKRDQKSIITLAFDQRDLTGCGAQLSLNSPLALNSPPSFDSPLSIHHPPSIHHSPSIYHSSNPIRYRPSPIDSYLNATIFDGELMAIIK
jgi:hypothetical protein